MHSLGQTTSDFESAFDAFSRHQGVAVRHKFMTLFRSVPFRGASLGELLDRDLSHRVEA